MAHINVRLGDKHVNVILDGLRSIIHDCDKVVDLDPNRLDKKQLKRYHKVKKQQDDAIAATVRITESIKPKHRK